MYICIYLYIYIYIYIHISPAVIDIISYALDNCILVFIAFIDAVAEPLPMPSANQFSEPSATKTFAKGFHNEPFARAQCTDVPSSPQ